MIFIDTGAFLARYLARDQYHREAMQAWKKLSKSGVRLYTSVHVLDETITLLGRWAGNTFAAERARLLYSSQALIILRSDHQDELAAIEDFEKYADQKVSFTDCLAFVLMRKHRLKRAFTFDKHFARAGFEIIDN